MVAMNSSHRNGRAKRRSEEESDDLGQTLTRIKHGATDLVKQTRQGTRSAAAELKRTAGEASDAVLSTIKEEADKFCEKQKSTAVAKVDRMRKLGKQAAHALHAIRADNLADTVESAVKQVQGATSYIEEHTLTEMIEDTSRVVRRNPALAVGLSFVAGFALARFLKADDAREEHEEESDDDASDAQASASDDDDDEDQQERDDDGDQEQDDE